LFHFTQAILRNAKRLGLWNGYLEDNEIKTMVKRLMALPLVPLHHIDDAWMIIAEDIPDDNHPLHGRCFIFLDYVLNTWVNENGAQYQTVLWNHYGNITDRTTNAAEGRHRIINSLMGKHRLNIHSFVREIRKDLVNAEVRIAQRVAGQPPPTQRPKYR
jgi:hypothetical protein